ncbi:MAG: hypothetical protein OQK48_07050 [Sulfurimonas sp.]|uniref:hypothetical protein n=1 Tax=Sulfurimonas sp. TaxID=2022749 RepID=UPI00262E40FB|nr:hypothetical protein [Sulfurimonas sp.]MCW8895206.1 hypothetical protein [Sulfurimonas sp.]MCW8954687.1 hypothetical protein [Sulfurimonas sp.]
MMKILPIIFLFLTLNLYADSKWISLEPTKSKQAGKSNTQLQELQPMKKMLKKATVIKHLLDKKSLNDETDKQSKKNWFVIK